jgi:hypothetical protein
LWIKCLPRVRTRHSSVWRREELSRTRLPSSQVHGDLCTCITDASSRLFLRQQSRFRPLRPIRFWLRGSGRLGCAWHCYRVRYLLCGATFYCTQVGDPPFHSSWILQGLHFAVHRVFWLRGSSWTPQNRSSTQFRQCLRPRDRRRLRRRRRVWILPSFAPHYLFVQGLGECKLCTWRDPQPEEDLGLVCASGYR